MGQFKRSDFNLKNKDHLNYINRRLQEQKRKAAEALSLYKREQVKNYLIILELKELLEAMSFKGVPIKDITTKLKAAQNKQQVNDLFSNTEE